MKQTTVHKPDERVEWDIEINNFQPDAKDDVKVSQINKTSIAFSFIGILSKTINIMPIQIHVISLSISEENECQIPIIRRLSLGGI